MPLKRLRRWIWPALAVLPLVLLLDRTRESRPYQAEWLPAGDTHVRVLRTGNGDTTVLLLHGYGESLLAYRGIVPALAERFRVVALDLPGSGLSGKPEGPYTLEAMVSRISSAMNRWMEGPVVVVGHSMGGAIAAGLAIERPDRVHRLVLIAPAGQGLGMGLGEGTLEDWERQVTAWALQARELIVPMEDDEWLRDPPDLPDPARSDSGVRNANAALLRDFRFDALKGRFHRVEQPTLLIWGGLDPLIPVETGREIMEQLPRGRMIEIGNSWHRPHVEHPGRVADEILAFLGDNQTERRLQ